LALDALGVRPELLSFLTDARVLFVGDSLQRDIRPARLLGMATAWIAPRGSEASEADVVIESLPELPFAVRRLHP
jgi:FMN phosphatase YigB (HAD superfamily)